MLRICEYTVDRELHHGRTHESLDDSTRCPAQMLRYALRSGGPGGLGANSPMTQTPTQYSYGP
jgi:hypothetical protein